MSCRILNLYKIKTLAQKIHDDKETHWCFQDVEGWDDLFPNTETVARALLGLNAEAYHQRYGVDADYDKPDWSNIPVSNTLLANEMSIAKILYELLNVCLEGDVWTFPLYKALEEYHRILLGSILSKLDIYQCAPDCDVNCVTAEGATQKQGETK